MTDKTTLEKLDLYLGQRMPFSCLGEKAKMKISPRLLLEYIVKALNEHTKEEVTKVLIEYIPKYWSDKTYG